MSGQSLELCGHSRVLFHAPSWGGNKELSLPVRRVWLQVGPKAWQDREPVGSLSADHAMSH